MRVSEVDEAPSGSNNRFLSRLSRLPIALALFLLFIGVLFPWDVVGRRVAWEISRVSGARVEVSELSPGISARGPVLRARDVTIQHPAVSRVQVETLEIAPRFSSSWLSGEPTLRIFAVTSLGRADGLLRLGTAPAYQGRVTEVDFARLPLRLAASALSLRGQLDADANVALDPQGTLSGSIDFRSPGLEIGMPLLPGPLILDEANGRLEILETGATRISDVRFEGQAIQGEVSGEIGLVHASQSPPIDLVADITLLDPNLRRLAPGAGLRLDQKGHSRFALRGTIDGPRVQPLPATAAK